MAHPRGAIMQRVKSHTLEWVIGILMAAFGIAAVWIFVKASTLETIPQEAAVIEILLIIVLAILAQTGVLIRIYENQQLMMRR